MPHLAYVIDSWSMHNVACGVKKNQTPHDPPHGYLHEIIYKMCHLRGLRGLFL